MKKGNKRYTKRMSLPLSVRTVRTVFFFYALHTCIQTHNPRISETQLCFKEFISLKAREERRYFFSGLLKKTYNPVRPEGFQSFLGKEKYIIPIFFSLCLSARLFLHIHVCLTINYQWISSNHPSWSFIYRDLHSRPVSAAATLKILEET